MDWLMDEPKLMSPFLLMQKKLIQIFGVGLGHGMHPMS